MVTATTSNVLTFQGRSGRIYNVNAYISDVVGAKVLLNMNGAAGAASDPYVVLPEDMALIEASFITGPTVAVGMILQQNGANLAASPLLFASFLNTLARLPKLGIGFKAGTQFSAIQF